MCTEQKPWSMTWEWNCYLKDLNFFWFYLITSIHCGLFYSMIASQDIAICIWVHGARLGESLCRTLFERNKIQAHFHSLQSLPKPRVEKRQQIQRTHPSNTWKKARLILFSTTRSFISAVCFLSPVCKEGMSPRARIEQEKIHSLASQGTWEQQDRFKAGFYVYTLSHCMALQASSLMAAAE